MASGHVNRTNRPNTCGCKKSAVAYFPERLKDRANKIGGSLASNPGYVAWRTLDMVTLQARRVLAQERGERLLEVAGRHPSHVKHRHSASRLFVRRAHFGRIDEVKRIFSSEPAKRSIAGSPIGGSGLASSLPKSTRRTISRSRIKNGCSPVPPVKPR